MKALLAAAAATLVLCACSDSKKTEKKAPPATPAAAADGAPTASAGITTAEKTYTVDDMEFRGYLATPAPSAAKRPGVVIVHEWWGHNDYARRRARMLAELGYPALAIDMYGGGKQAAHPKDAMAFSSEALANKDVTAARFEAALKLLEAEPGVDASRIAAIGYCFGGAVVLEMAKRGVNLSLVASFHGPLSTATTFARGAISGHVFVAHGAADSFVPAEAVDAFKKQLTDGGADLEFVAYENAKHSFTNPDADANAAKFDIDLAYNKEADQASWARLVELLAAL